MLLNIKIPGMETARLIKFCPTTGMSRLPPIIKILGTITTNFATRNAMVEKPGNDFLFWIVQVTNTAKMPNSQIRKYSSGAWGIPVRELFNNGAMTTVKITPIGDT